MDNSEEYTKEQILTYYKLQDPQNVEFRPERYETSHECEDFKIFCEREEIYRCQFCGSSYFEGDQ